MAVDDDAQGERIRIATKRGDVVTVASSDVLAAKVFPL
jgi:hypothetical protein